MRICFLIPCVLGIILSSAMTQTAAAQNDETYDIPLIKGLLQHPEGLGWSLYDKQLDRLGDRVSIALLKALGEEELKNPQKIRTSLLLIRKSFSFPTLISITEDKKPKVTLFLLKHWEGEAKDPELKGEISELINFVKDKTAAMSTQP